MGDSCCTRCTSWIVLSWQCYLRTRNDSSEVHHFHIMRRCIRTHCTGILIITCHSAHNNYQSYCKTVCSQRIQRYAQLTLLKLMNTEVGDYFILSAASKQVDYPVRVWLPKAAGEQTEMNLWLYSMTGLLDKTISAVGWSHFLLNWSPWIHEWGRTCGEGSEITVLFFPSTSSSSLQKLQYVTIQ